MKNKPIKATDGSGAKTARAEIPPVWSVVATIFFQLLFFFFFALLFNFE